MRTLIYLQAEFWNKISSDKSVEGVRACMNVYDALSDADIRTDINPDQLELNNPDSTQFPFDRFLFQIFKDRFNGKGGTVDFNYSTEPEDETIDQLSAIHLQECDNSHNIEVGNKWGVLAFNSSQITRKRELFKGSGIILQKGVLYKEKYQKYAPIIRIPCNSMLIIDPYLLADPRNISNSFASWLDAILPVEKMSVKFQLAIFSMINDEHGNQVFGEDIKNVHSKIVGIINEKRNKLDISLTVYAIAKGEDFHSRNVITNNVLIQAPDGIALYKQNGVANKNATLDLIIPRLYGDDRMDLTKYEQWIRIAKKRSEKASEMTYCGSKENRLFDLV